MKLHWATGDVERSGNQFGFAVHNDESRKAIEAAGVTLDDAAEVSLYVGSPINFSAPADGRRHVLYTAWDSTSLPPSALKAMQHVDVLILTSSYLVPVFEPIVKPGTPIYVCPLGVDIERFACSTRRKLRRDERMRVLWVGAPNPRKGFQFANEVSQAMNGWPFDFYFKTTTPEQDKAKLVTRGHTSGASVTFDSRRLPLDEMIALYHNAHAFLFPTMGEGFGLTLAEAMASGLPCVFTPWSGVTDFADATVALPTEFKVVRAEMGPNIPEDAPGYAELCLVGEVAMPDLRSICTKLAWVFEHYKRAAVLGEKAALRMRTRFTWRHTGERLKEILEESCQPVFN